VPASVGGYAKAFAGIDVRVRARATGNPSNQRLPTPLNSPDSGIRLDDSGSCKSCGLLHYTEITDAEQLIDQSRWDGSDFFMVWPLPRFVFVTKRVANVIRDHHLTGVRIQPVSELKPSPHVIPGYSPGRLSYWMPEKRARELGEPLGIY
jgi:hypothetical protein